MNDRRGGGDSFLEDFQAEREGRAMAKASTGRSDMGWGPLAPWEIKFLSSGREPAPRYIPLFGMLYETADWQLRWEQAQKSIVRIWRRMSPQRRPRDWICYLAEIGYLSPDITTELLVDWPALPPGSRQRR
jgi:hypothetical protein